MGLRLRPDGFALALLLTVIALPNLVLAAPLMVGKMLLWKAYADATREGVCDGW